MGQLPFLVVHGAVVWKLLLVALVALTYVIAYLFRQRRARRLALAAIARQVISSPTRGPVIVRGRIKSGVAATASQFDKYVDTRSEELSLDCDGTLVAIDGPVRVEQGTTTVTGWNTKVGRSLGVGDEVIAVGSMTEGPTEAGSYRDGTPTWRLHAAEAVQLLATRPQARATPLSIGQHVGALLAVSTLWFGALYLTGSRALAYAGDHRTSHFDGELPAFSASELAAAMPGSREQALWRIGDELAFLGNVRSERALQAEVALREVLDECPARLLAGSVSLEPALAAARRCDPTLVPYLLAFEGRFAEAERALAPHDQSEETVEIHIATGHWAAAAAGAESRATRLENAPGANAEQHEYLHEAALQSRCTAALFRSFGGDHEAFAKLDRGKTPACAIVEAASLPAADLGTALAAIPEPSETARIQAAGFEIIADDLALTTTSKQPRYPSNTGVMAMLFPHDEARVWLAPLQLAAHPDDESTDLARRSMVALAALEGNMAAAREQLGHVTDRESHSTLGIALALRDGSPLDLANLTAFSPQEESISLRKGMINGKIQSYLDDHEGEEFHAGLQQAADGDGRGLAAALQFGYLQWQAFSLPMLGLLPRITNHREEAMAALRVFRNELGTYNTSRIPFDVVSDAALYRDAARLIGDTADAAQWQSIIERYADVLRDRQRLLAFLFWRE